MTTFLRRVWNYSWWVAPMTLLVVLLGASVQNMTFVSPPGSPAATTASAKAEAGYDCTQFVDRDHRKTYRAGAIVFTRWKHDGDRKVCWSAHDAFGRMTKFTVRTTTKVVGEHRKQHTQVLRKKYSVGGDSSIVAKDGRERIVDIEVWDRKSWGKFRLNVD